MSTTTHRIPITADEYVNVSNGNTNCSLAIPSGARLRLCWAGSVPDKDEPNFIPVRGLGDQRGALLTASDLEAEADLWVRSESKEVEVVVVRGPGKLILSNLG